MYDQIQSAPLRLSLSLILLALPPSPAPAQAIPEALPATDVQLLPNGAMDIGDGAAHPFDWDVEGNVEGIHIINRKPDRFEGSACLEINDTPLPGATVRSRKISAVPGGDYTATAQVKLKQGKPPALVLEFWDFNRKSLGSAQSAPTADAADWQTVTVKSTAPEGAAHLTVSLRSPADSPGGHSIWDDLQLHLAPPPYDPALGTARELFLDDARIESAVRVGRVVHPARTTTRPVLRPDRPWESSAYIYGTVIKEGDTYRMWYTAYNAVAPNYHTAYAQSHDGLTWEKPNLGLVDFKGSKDNNLLGPCGGTIAYNPGASPDRRYASLGFQSGKVNQTLGYYMWFSPDGLHWKRASEKPALLDGDVSNLSYDPVTKRYIATVKKRMFTARTPGIYERTAFVSTSTDGLTWESPWIGVSGDYADDGATQALGGFEAQIYGMPVSRYESTYVGFPWVFRILNYTQGGSAHTGDGPVEIQIASSRDLHRWARPVRDPVILPGPIGSWNQGAHYTASNFLVDDTSIHMYYAAFNNGHGGADKNDPNRGGNHGMSGLATWRRDGWVSLTNGSLEDLGTPGTLTTKPLTFTAKSLHVNADIHPGGKLQVDVLDASNNTPLPGYSSKPLAGDHLDAPVDFDKPLSDLASRPVKLRFTLVDCDLYSYWITP